MICKQELKNLRNTFASDEGLADMDRVVNKVYNGKDNTDTGDYIDGDVPEMKKSNNIGEGEDHDEDDQDADLDVTEKKESNKEDTEHGQSQISP